MAVHAASITLSTDGHGDTVDITGQAQSVVTESGLSTGVLTLFVPGSTGGLTTIEFEPGAVSDFQRLFDEIVPVGREYKHHLRWGDDNGHSHVRAALLGPSLSIPFTGGKLTLGTWQQIIFCDFDTGPRERTIAAHASGE
jgi:secondary thiamine-phosphate synthase enzyme